MKELLEHVTGFAAKAMGDDADKYKEALAVGVQALDSARNLFAALEDGNEVSVRHALTAWEDVNRTWEAVGKMDRAIEDAKNGIELMEVLETIGKVVSIATTVAAFL